MTVNRPRKPAHLSRVAAYLHKQMEQPGIFRHLSRGTGPPAGVDLVDKRFQAQSLGRRFGLSICQGNDGSLAEIVANGRNDSRGGRSDNAVDADGVDHAAGSPPEEVDRLGDAQQDQVIRARSNIGLCEPDQFGGGRFHGPGTDFTRVQLKVRVSSRCFLV